MDTKISITNAHDDLVHKLATVEVAFPDRATGVVYNTMKLSFRMAADPGENDQATTQRALAIARELAQQFAGTR